MDGTENSLGTLNLGIKCSTKFETTLCGAYFPKAVDALEAVVEG